MSIFRRKKEEPVAPAPNTEERGLCSVALRFNGGGAGNVRAMQLAAVYRCVEVISDSVAQLPLAPYEIVEDGTRPYYNHPSYNLLSKEPSPTMSRFTFIKGLVTSMLLNGNGYAYILRDGLGNPRQLVFLPPTAVTINDNGNVVDPERISYTINGTGMIPSRDIIHVLNHSNDGVHGISTLTHAMQSLSLAWASEQHAKGFFSGGANLGGIITVQGPLNQKQGDDIKEKWISSFGPTGTPNGIAVLPGNMTFQPISVNPSDAQLLETRQYSVVDICRFFGVSPVKCFDLTHSSYSTVEATQLAFLTDTLAPILEKIELEFERKLFRDDEKFRIDVRFDTSALLRADMTSRANFVNAMFNMGSMSINEVRAEMGLPPIDNGNTHFLQVNLQTLDNALNPPMVPDPDPTTQE